MDKYKEDFKSEIKKQELAMFLYSIFVSGIEVFFYNGKFENYNKCELKETVYKILINNEEMFKKDAIENNLYENFVDYINYECLGYCDDGYIKNLNKIKEIFQVSEGNISSLIIGAKEKYFKENQKELIIQIDKNKKLELKNSELDTSLKVMVNELNSFKDTISKVEKEKNEIKKEVKSFRIERNNLNNKIAQLEKEKIDLSYQIELNKSKQVKMNDKLENLKKLYISKTEYLNNSVNEEEINNLRVKNNNLENNNAILKENNKLLISKKESLEESIRILNTENNLLKQKLENECLANNRKINIIENKNKELINKLNVIEEKYKDTLKIKSENKELKNKIKKLQNEKVYILDKLEDSNKDWNKIEENVEDFLLDIRVQIFQAIITPSLDISKQLGKQTCNSLISDIDELKGFIREKNQREFKVVLKRVLKYVNEFTEQYLSDNESIKENVERLKQFIE